VQIYLIRLAPSTLLSAFLEVLQDILSRILALTPSPVVHLELRAAGVAVVVVVEIKPAELSRRRGAKTAFAPFPFPPKRNRFLKRKLENYFFCSVCAVADDRDLFVGSVF
jgi:hypothetical protein